jgi:hypothetical protein
LTRSSTSTTPAVQSRSALAREILARMTIACILASALPRCISAITGPMLSGRSRSSMDGSSESGSVARTAPDSSHVRNTEKSPPAPLSARACVMTRPST